jgi:pimeloyl-ACP methyl ester carboxylesterase
MDLARIAAPTLLIWGEWDRWLPRESVQSLGGGVGRRGQARRPGADHGDVVAAGGGLGLRP